MISYIFKYILFLLSILVLASCNNFKKNDYKAYFGGEIVNPKGKYVLFYQGDELLDSIALDDKNRFFKEFDSLQPGLYVFNYDSEYQYIYFDKNDSLMVHINAINFDDLMVFSGRGEEKNNYLIEMYLKNARDRNQMYNEFNLSPTEFIASADKSYKDRLNFYETSKQESSWSDAFDKIARASVDFHHFTKKEFYPIAYFRKEGKVLEGLPVNYYDFRNNIDFNNEDLANFYPYVRYLNARLNHFIELQSDKSYKTAVNKLNIVDSLITNQRIKNKLLNEVASMYLLEDQSSCNKAFLERYCQLSTDKKKQQQIKKIGESIQKLSPNKELPIIQLITLNNDTISSNSLFNRKTLLFFWSRDASNHINASHKKIEDLTSKFKDINIISVNLDPDPDQWYNTVSSIKTISNISHYRVADFNEVKDKWVITKVNRSLVVDKDGKIINAFVNIFDKSIEQYLK